jgi:hypothetical protein
MDMDRGNNKIIFVIIFLIFAVIVVLFLKSETFSPTVIPESQGSKIAGLLIQFRDGITDQEVKNILENYNLTLYKIDYNFDYLPDRSYIVVDKDKIMDVREGLRKEENWTESTPAIEKGDYYIIMISNQAIHDKNFIEILNKHNLQVKTSIWCHVSFTDRPWDGISKEHANELKRELETNENIFSVDFESIVS